MAINLPNILPFLTVFVLVACSEPETKAEPRVGKKTKEIKAYIAGKPEEITMAKALKAIAVEKELAATLHGYGEALIEDRLGHPRARDEASNEAKKRLLEAARAETERFLSDFEAMAAYPEDGPIARWRKARKDAMKSMLERLKKYSVTVARHKPVKLPAKTIIFVKVAPAKLYELLKKELGAYFKGAGGRPYSTEQRQTFQSEFDKRSDSIIKGMLEKQKTIAETYGFKKAKP